MEFKPITKEQKELIEATEFTVIGSGSWGSGKTHAGVVKAYIMAGMYSKNRVALVRKKQIDLRATTWKCLVDKVIPAGAIKYQNKNELTIELQNGSEIVGIGLDSDQAVVKTGGREYGFVLIDEARELGKSDFDEKIIRTLRLPTVPFHQVLLLTNPDSPSHWIHKEYFEKTGNHRVINSKTLPPPHLPDSYYQRLDQLTGVYKARYRDGLWVAFEGQVYPFDPKRHVIEPFEIEVWRRRIIGIDFGFDEPFVARWWFEKDGKWYMYRQIYMSQRTVQNHGKQIKEFIKQDNAAQVYVYCDHDAEDVQTLKDELADCDKIQIYRADKRRTLGIQFYFDLIYNDRCFYFSNSLVEKDERLEMREKPTEGEGEFGLYGWKDNSKKEETQGPDHAMDTDRYALFSFATSGSSFNIVQDIRLGNMIMSAKPDF